MTENEETIYTLQHNKGSCNENDERQIVSLKIPCHFLLNDLGDDPTSTKLFLHPADSPHQTSACPTRRSEPLQHGAWSLSVVKNSNKGSYQIDPVENNEQLPDEQVVDMKRFPANLEKCVGVVARDVKWTDFYCGLTNQAVIDKKQENPELSHLGGTNEHFQIECNSKSELHKSKKIAEIGNKIRDSLKEEKRKRKEIIRIDDNIELNNNTIGASMDLKKKRHRSPSSFSTAIKNTKQKKKETSTTRRRKVQRVAISKKSIDLDITSRKKDKYTDRKERNYIDLWKPSATHLSCMSLPKDKRSVVVRIHGVPLDCKPEHLRKFFRGLKIENIFYLPSCNVFINDFDSIYSYASRKEHPPKRRAPSSTSEKPNIKRETCNLRIYVKFESVTVADFAIARTGEMMSAFVPVGSLLKTGNVLKEPWCEGSAAVLVTPVPKDQATFFMKYMVWYLGSISASFIFVSAPYFMLCFWDCFKKLHFHILLVNPFDCPETFA